MARRSANTKGRRGMDSRRRKAARLAGRGLSNAAVASRLGLKSKRARKGVTVAEWKRDPNFQAVMRDEIAKDMSESEVKNRRAAQARGEIPTKVVCVPDGVRQEFDTDSALAACQRILGMNSETHRLELPGDRDEALLEVQKVLALFGVKASVDEISAKLEAAGE
jgi:hypothetical protein